ncbi:helix-turn-helix domain-containing protein [Catenulispora pinisilvae]|uniref:helix-turn-helix domain-containing protein n=1 Tax=Catenulispora pinisilvae TaxID=2705253 RepID=UPI001890DFC5|nr:helix-turn-helix domain-containing protein [Catenulispora pinisilvae]
MSGTPIALGDLAALPPTLDIVTAARLLGIGRTTAFGLLRKDRFPCRVLRFGTTVRVPTADLLAFLGLAAPVLIETAAGATGEADPDDQSEHRPLRLARVEPDCQGLSAT